MVFYQIAKTPNFLFHFYRQGRAKDNLTAIFKISF